MRVASAVVASFLLLAVTGVPAAQAHSFPETESPAAGQTLSAAPGEVRIKYDAPIEELFAGLKVLDQNGRNVAEGPPTVGPDGYTLSVKLAPIGPGRYSVRWSVVCVDTHRTQGSYVFSVAGGAGR